MGWRFIYNWFVGRGLDPSFAILWLGKIARGVGDAAPYTRNLFEQQTIKIAVIARLLGGVKTPPYDTILYRGVGAHSVRPGNLATTRDPTGEQCSPLQGGWLPLRGAPPVGGEGWLGEVRG